MYKILDTIAVTAEPKVLRVHCTSGIHLPMWHELQRRAAAHIQLKTHLAWQAPLLGSIFLILVNRITFTAPEGNFAYGHGAYRHWLLPGTQKPVTDFDALSCKT